MTHKVLKIVTPRFLLYISTMLTVASLMSTCFCYSNELQDVLERNDKQVELINVIRENIENNSREREDLYQLAADLGIDSVEDITIDIIYGKIINIKIFIYGTKEYEGNRFAQKILVVFSDKFNNEILPGNTLKRGNFFSSHNNINFIYGCDIRDGGGKLEVIVDKHLSCKDVANLITEIKNGNIHIEKSLAGYLGDFRWKDISVRSRSNNIFQINSKISETSSKVIEVEKINEKYILLSVSVIES